MTIRPKAPLLDASLTRPDWLSSVPRREGLLWLDKNENADPSLRQITERVLHEVGARGLSTYPEFGELYRKLARWVEVSPDSLVLTPGSDGAIRKVFEAFVSEGDKVVHTSPTFAMYPVYCKMFGASASLLHYENTAKGPALATDAVLAHLRRERPVLFCLPNPDSPTGTILPPEELRAIVELCANQGCVALIDEAYHPFYDHSCARWTRELENLVVARTFAKAWGLAGIRLGYAVGHPDTVRYFHKLRPMYEVSTIAAVVAERMLDFADEMQASVRRLNEGKSYFLQRMEGLGFRTLHAEGNFLHVAFGQRAAAIHRALQDRVLYRADSNEPCLKGYSRFSATTRERFQPLVEVIAGVTRD